MIGSLKAPWRGFPATILIGFLSVRALAFAGDPDDLNLRLLRTTQIGVPQGLTVAGIKNIAADNNRYDAYTQTLARSALLVLGEDNVKSLVSVDEVLDAALNNATSQSAGLGDARGLPAGFAAKESIFTLVYAFVMGGQQERVTSDLERHLFTGSAYKQAIVLQALRNIGTPRAVGLVQRYAEKGEDKQMAQNTLADEDYPVLFEMHDRWNMVPPRQRGRESLVGIVNSGCNQRTALAAYWLGYYGKNSNSQGEKAEIDALKSVQGKNGPDCEMMEHIIALKALGLRTAETPAYWTGLLKNEKVFWIRRQIAIIGYARWGKAFNPYALEALETEPVQYVQWELLDGNFETRLGRTFRNYWDIWIPVTVLFPAEYPYSETGAGKLSGADLDTLLAWVEAGNRPRDEAVENRLLQKIGRFVSGPETRRYLAVMNRLPGRQEKLTLLNEMEDPQALPVLRYWVGLGAPAAERQQLQYAINRLEQAKRVQSSRESCCDDTEACLRKHVSQPDPAETIGSEQELRLWLLSGVTSDPALTVSFTDELKHQATVSPANGPRQSWEYLYDCWRRTDSQGDAGAR